MNVLHKNYLITYFFVGIIGFAIATKNHYTNQVANATKLNLINSSKVENTTNIDDGLTNNSKSSTLQQNRPLRMSISVDNPSFLKVKVGQTIKKDDVISDNSTERDRLARQRQSVKLQIDNLSSKNIPKPFEPINVPKTASLPAANFLEEESAIAQASLKLQQAQSLLESRTQILQSDNPQIRAESEKAEAALRNATEQVREQEELIKNVQDLKLDNSVIRHEEAKLLQLRGEEEQKRSQFDQVRAKLNFSAIEQQQELQRLQIAVQLAQSELQIYQSKLEKAKSDRRLLEYKASIESVQRIEQENQSKLSYSQQQQNYAQSVRNKDYQLAQLQLSLSAIDDKLSQIPVVLSPKDGYIRRIKPWVGRDGKYTTTITITSDVISSKN